MTETSEPSRIVNPPTPSAYLPQAIQKAVVDKGIKHPATIYPIAFGISSGIVGWLFELPLLYAAAVGLSLIGPIWATITIFFHHEKIGSRYIQHLNRQQQAYEKQLKNQIKSGLEECRGIKGIKSYAGQGTEQLNNIQIKFDNVQDLLKMKLRSGELTYGRFQGAAEQVSLSVLDNLKKVVGILKSAGSIKPDHLRERLHKFAQKQDRTPEDVEEAKALKKRLELWEEQLKKVSRLLVKNEEAMTEMEKVSAAIAEWETDGRFADTNFESAITRLHELAEQAYEYNT